jgi:DMSO/TMAO reductase YedYZ molybdopterin-dependent catalytic subunit
MRRNPLAMHLGFLPLARIGGHPEILPTAHFVNFHPFDDVADGIDMLDELHPQTILAYA